MSDRTAWLRARLPPEKLKAYKRAARADKRTLTNWIELHLDAVVEERPKQKASR